MDYAKERRGSEKLIRADDAFPRRYYTCPTCFAEVYLRRGRWRAAHFAHRSGQGKPDCENFHPSDPLTYTWHGGGGGPGAGSNYRPNAPLLLSIELEPESMLRGRKLRGWELRLTVPKAEDARGRITIDCGGGITRTVTLAKLSDGAQTYQVARDGEDFGALWVSPEVRPQYKAVVEDRVLGLDKELANLFASTAQRYKPRVDRASWGNSYYLVWHDTCGLAIPRKLVAQPLASADQWHCSFITLPDDEDTEIKKWLEEITAVAVSSQRRVFGVVYPPPCGLDILGRLILPAADRLIVGFRQNDSELGSAVVLRATAGSAASQVSLEGSGRHLVQIEMESGSAQIALKLDEFTLPLLVPASVTYANVFLDVRFVFNDLANSRRKEASLTSSEGLSLLANVRRGQAEIFECTSPSGVKGSVRWKAEQEITWSSLSLGGDSDAASVSATRDEIVELNKCLQNRRYEIELDFGAFGSFCAPSEKCIGRDVEVAVPSHVRKRIHWLCSVCCVFSNDRGIPIKRLDDREIVHLVERMRVPTQFVAQHRAIASSLARLSVGTFAR